ncbi:3'-5' exonuclease-like [Oculina patagonica]
MSDTQARRRSQTAVDASDNEHYRGENTSSPRWTTSYEYSEDSSRKTRLLSTVPLSRRNEDHCNSRSCGYVKNDSYPKTRVPFSLWEEDCRTGLPLWVREKPFGSSYVNQAPLCERQSESRRTCFESSNENTSPRRVHDGPRQARSQLLFQDVRTKTTNDGNVAKYQRCNVPEGRHLLRKTPRCFTTTATIRHELADPPEAIGVEVVYTNNLRDGERWLRKHIVDCSARAVGFDMEWKPQFVSKKKGGEENETAVLQFGVETSCLVLHVYHMGELPKSLSSILIDENILKVGSGIQRDAFKVERDRDLVCKGLVDTQEMAKSFGLQKVGLKALAKDFLGVELEDMWFANWEHFPLELNEVKYAALDAWVGLKIFQEMKQQRSFSQERDTTAEALDQDHHKESLNAYNQEIETETSFVYQVGFIFIIVWFLSLLVAALLSIDTLP